MNSFILSAIALIVPVLGLAQNTIVTTEGTIYRDATISGLTPKGVVVTFESGAATIPYDSLPENLQTRYALGTAYPPVATQEAITGVFAIGGVSGGEYIEFSGHTFSYTSSSDVPDAAAQRRYPIVGQFTVNGHWIYFHARGVFSPIRIITKLKNRFVLMTPENYQRWKDSGDAAWAGGPSQIPPK